MIKFLPVFYFALLLVTGCDRTSPRSAMEHRTVYSAADHGDAEKIRILVRSGKQVDEIGPSGLTPLARAVMAHHLDATKALVSLGANIHFKTDQGEDLVMLAMYHEKDDPLEMLGYLVSLGLRVDNVSLEDNTALNIAINNFDERAVAKLMALGAKPNAKTTAILGRNTDIPPKIIELVGAK